MFESLTKALSDLTNSTGSDEDINAASLLFLAEVGVVLYGAYGAFYKSYKYLKSTRKSARQQIADLFVCIRELYDKLKNLPDLEGENLPDIKSWRDLKDLLNFITREFKKNKELFKLVGVNIDKVLATIEKLQAIQVYAAQSRGVLTLSADRHGMFAKYFKISDDAEAGQYILEDDFILRKFAAMMNAAEVPENYINKSQEVYMFIKQYISYMLDYFFEAAQQRQISLCHALSCRNYSAKDILSEEVMEFGDKQYIDFMKEMEVVNSVAANCSSRASVHPVETIVQHTVPFNLPEVESNQHIIARLQSENSRLLNEIEQLRNGLSRVHTGLTQGGSSTSESESVSTSLSVSPEPTDEVVVNVFSRDFPPEILPKNTSGKGLFVDTGILDTNASFDVVNLPGETSSL